MKHIHVVAVLLGVGALGALEACKGDSTGPGGGGGGTLTASVNDSLGDVFGSDTTVVQPDLTALSIIRDTGGATITMDFTANIQSPVTGGANVVEGVVDIDVDQNPATGVETDVDFFRVDGNSTGMWMEYYVDLGAFNPYTADSVTVFAIDTLFNIVATGNVRPTFSGKRLSFRLPRSLVGGDDMLMNVAVVMGNTTEPTDLAPNDGHLKVGGTGPVAPNRLGVSALRVGRGRGRVWGTRR
jgi:hypothetical protein